MKKMLFVVTLLIGICSNQCLAWTIVKIDNELNDDVVVQLVADDTVLSLDRVIAHTRQNTNRGGIFTPIECPICERFTNLVEGCTPSIKEYLLVTVGQRRFIICEGGRIEKSYGSTCQGTYATWVCEVKSDTSIKLLAWTLGFYGMSISRDYRYILKLSLLPTRRPTKANPDKLREDIVFDLMQ